MVRPTGDGAFYVRQNGRWYIVRPLSGPPEALALSEKAEPIPDCPEEDEAAVPDNFNVEDALEVLGGFCFLQREKPARILVDDPEGFREVRRRVMAGWSFVCRHCGEDFKAWKRSPKGKFNTHYCRACRGYTPEKGGH